MKMIHIILYFFAFLSSYTTSYYASDFCVADLKLPNTPSGYPCKSEAKVTVNDFVFSGLVPGNTEGPFNFALKTAFVNDLPGLNGLGQIIAGFITPTKLIVKTLNSGDVMVFPKGLMHFGVNTGVGKASAYAAYSSSNPSIQSVDVLLFGNTLSTAILQKTTLLHPAQIKKLKAVFGGSG
ncbi:hypothetical protein P8452_68844 [Trifolium repens]|nr:hypothetical protein P8452_68844 [Trifolium repens]